MAKIQNIKIGETSYQIKDGSAVQFGSALPTASADYAGKLFNQTSDGKLYICTKTSENQYVWTEYLSLFNAVLLNESNVGNLNLTGNLTVSGNISQHGEAYITEAEKVESKDDYIAMRHGNTSALSDSEYSGLEIENYDGGNNNLRLVVDNKGVARVGDTGDEQPLLTRVEESELSSGSLMIWDNSKKRVSPRTSGVEYIALPNLSYQTVGSSTSSKRDYFEKLIKYIVTNYSAGTVGDDGIDKIFIGKGTPSVGGLIQIHFYAVYNYSNGLPRYCSGVFNGPTSDDTIWRFGVWDGAYWCKQEITSSLSFWKGSQSDYNAISSKDSNTIYYIV